MQCHAKQQPGLWAYGVDEMRGGSKLMFEPWVVRHVLATLQPGAGEAD
jgi:hypothetical protein